MQKINWINGQAGGTPLSAENLNLMQDYIEEAMEGDSDFTADDGYVRFENGLQIAWKKANVTAGGTAWSGTAVWYSDHNMGNWKIPFDTIFTAISDVEAPQFWTNTFTVTKNSAGTIRCFRPNSSTGPAKISIIGIGTWK